MLPFPLETIPDATKHCQGPKEPKKTKHGIHQTLPGTKKTKKTKFQISGGDWPGARGASQIFEILFFEGVFWVPGNVW